MRGDDWGPYRGYGDPAEEAAVGDYLDPDADESLERLDRDATVPSLRSVPPLTRPPLPPARQAWWRRWRRHRHG